MRRILSGLSSDINCRFYCRKKKKKASTKSALCPVPFLFDKQQTFDILGIA